MNKSTSLIRLIEAKLGDIARLVGSDTANVIKDAKARVAIDEPRKKEYKSLYLWKAAAEDLKYAIALDRNSGMTVATSGGNTKGVWNPDTKYGWLIDAYAYDTEYVRYWKFLADKGQLATMHWRAFNDWISKENQAKLEFKSDNSVVAINKATLDKLGADLGWEIQYYPTKKEGALEVFRFIVPNEPKLLPNEFFSIRKGGYNK